MADYSSIPETTISVAPASSYHYLRPMSEGGGPTVDSFTKLFDEAMVGAKTDVLKAHGLTDDQFNELTDGQKNTLTLEMIADVNAVSKTSLYGKNGLDFIGGQWVRKD